MQVSSDLDFNSVARINNLPNAVSAQQPATKAQLDAAVEGLAWKDNVKVATQANVSISAPGATIDGITMAANDRVLVRAQTAGAENGIYIWTGAATPMTRSLDADTSSDITNATVTVDQGTSAGATYRQSVVAPTVGTTTITFASFGTAAPAASTASPGIAQLATQDEVDTGTDANKIVTPATLAGTSRMLKKYAVDIGDGSATSYAVTHNLGTTDVQVQVWKTTGNKDLVVVDVQRTSTTVVTIVFASAPAAGAYRVVVMG